MCEVNQDIVTLIAWKQSNSVKFSSSNPVLRALVDGICDENCLLSMFIGTPHILQTIWNIVSKIWKRHILDGVGLSNFSEPLDNVAFHQFPIQLNFPEPKGLHINMMPFVMETTFEKCKLPQELKPYWDEIINKDYRISFYSRKLLPENELGKIGYLTIHESLVGENKTQRRPGLHTDCPGKLMIAPNDNGDYVCLGRVAEEEVTETFELLESKIGDGICKGKVINYTHPWGFGMTRNHSELIGGIFMASNVIDSCAVWDCRIIQSEKEEEIIGNLGDVEHLRDFLPESKVMVPNRMYWITDRTPHESLPLKSSAYRQYFRLVTSNVSIWFEEHSTKNPLGVTPDSEITTIVKGSKFDKNWRLLLDPNPSDSMLVKEDKMNREELMEKEFK